MKERNKAVPAVYLVLMRDDEILLARRASTGYHDGWYSLPAGHVEFQESPTEALIRECKEEIDINLVEVELRLTHISYNAGYDETGDRVNLFFVSEVGHSHEPKIMEPDKCEDLLWCKLNELPKNTVQPVRHAIEEALAGNLFSEINYETLDQWHKEYQKSLK